MKTSSVMSYALAAAATGLLGGTAFAAQPATSTSSNAAVTGVVLVHQDAPAKHSCKGKNDCKGQGGGKNAGKNSCKGKGNCATDGSKGPKSLV